MVGLLIIRNKKVWQSLPRSQEDAVDEQMMIPFPNMLHEQICS